MCRGTPVPRTACSSAASCRLVSLNSQAPGCCGQRKTSSFSLVQGFPTYLATEHYLFGCLLVSLISMTSILPNNLLWNSYEMTNIAATEILIVRLCSSIVWMSARAAMKKYHRMDDINDRHLFPHSSEAGNPKLSWFSVRPVSWFVDDCLPTVFSPGLPSSPAYMLEREKSLVSLPLLQGHQSYYQGPTLMTSHPWRPYLQIQSHWGVRLQQTNLEKTQFSTWQIISFFLNINYVWYCDLK